MNGLDMEQAWVIDCDRCSAEENYGGERAVALETALRMGWQKSDDGYQTCPQCKGRP